MQCVSYGEVRPLGHLLATVPTVRGASDRKSGDDGFVRHLCVRQITAAHSIYRLPSNRRVAFDRIVWIGLLAARPRFATPPARANDLCGCTPAARTIQASEIPGEPTNGTECQRQGDQDHRNDVGWQVEWSHQSGRSASCRGCIGLPDNCMPPNAATRN